VRVHFGEEFEADDFATLEDGKRARVELVFAAEIAEAAEALIDKTITDLYEVGRRELRLSQLLHRARRSAKRDSQPPVPE
jgi:hypothetical protein